MNKIKRYVLIVFGVVLIMIGTNCATWYYGRADMARDKDAEWLTKIQYAPAETVTVLKDVKIPARNVVLPGKPVILTVEDVRRIDSMIAANGGLKGENDSLKELITQLAQPRRAEKKDSAVSVQVHYYPLDKLFDISWQFTPVQVPVSQTTKTVLNQEARPWLLINGGVGYNAGKGYGYVEANITVRERLYVVPRWDTYAGRSVELGYTLIEW
jgi:hypothetical protein